MLYNCDCDCNVCNYSLSNFDLLGHIEVVKLLASHGAEVACKDKKSYTPLHAAASSGMISVVKYLLDMGVDVSLSVCLAKMIGYNTKKPICQLS